jgi:hypothetical protein
MDIACFAQDTEMMVTARTPEEAVINGYAFADKTCAPVELPELLLIRPPKYGVICYRIEDFEVAGDSGLDRAWIGRWVRGVSVFYLARSGYSGPDSLRYEAIDHRGRERVSVRVGVLLDHSNTSASADDPSRESAMSDRPIPTCFVPVS